MPEAVLSGLFLEAVYEKCFHLIFMHQKGLLYQLIHSLAVGMYLCRSASDGPAVYLYMAVADLEGVRGVQMHPLWRLVKVTYVDYCTAVLDLF